MTARTDRESAPRHERLAAIASSIADGICAIDRAGRVTFMNPAAVELLGWQQLDELHDLSDLPADVDGPMAPSFILAPAMRSMSTDRAVSSDDGQFQRRDGTQFDVAYTVSPLPGAAQPSGAVLVFRDIKDRKELELQLTSNAFLDAMTGLPNRRLFFDHLDHALRRAERSSERHAVLICDIDRFKLVNDSLGHHAGDSMLVAVADRLKGTLRQGDMLARIGGDEFAILLEGVEGPGDAVTSAQRILDSLRRPLALVGGHDVIASLSIGIALSAPGQSRDALANDADVAMSRAKGMHGGDRYEVFDAAAMGHRSAERLDLELELRHALDREELEVYYQPVVRIGDRAIVGAEALVRWNHPTRGLLSPGQFISLAEETGQILAIGRFVLEQACRQAKHWLDVDGVALTVGVNLSARQFQHAGLADEVAEIVHLVGVDPAQLSLEITESLAMHDVARTSAVLAELKALGVGVAIDDFGTGYSSLGYLASFPIDVIKIDRSFVEGIELDRVKAAIVAAVFSLAAALGCGTVVEGIETAAELDCLASLGCTEAQGFYFARPQPAPSFSGLLCDAGPAAQPRGERAAIAKR